MPMLDLMTPGLPPALGEAFSQFADTVDKLSRRVRDMSQEELEYVGPAGNINSTATLLGHLAVVNLHYLHCIKGERVPPELDEAYGPYQTEDGKLPQVTGKAVGELLEQQQLVLGMAREYLQTLSDADATREVTIPWWTEPASVRYVLWHMSSHSMLHQGHIGRLREWYKQQNA